MMPDNPIITKGKDLLHRYPLAHRIAGMISDFKDNDSLVIGIEGEWGSGKTSFINLILEDLRTTNALLITFNPWNFSDQNELIKDFFDSIIDALKEADGQGGETKANKIKGYASKLLKQSGITISPEINALGLVSFKLGDISTVGGEEPLEKQKEAINKLLKEFGKRIVIVIDDIDRLDNHETKLIFKLVKMTANFANTIFLLAYDRGKVSERIDEKGIKGEEYLKKIIQVSFPLPKPDPQDLFTILTSDLDTSIQGFDTKYWDEVRWGNLCLSGFKSLFPTIRDIKRYISSLRLDLAIISKEEVNPIDFLGIEAIRVFTPEIYLAMGDEKRAFTATNSLYFGSGNGRDREQRKNFCEHIITDKSSPELTNAMRGIVKELFPQVKGFYTNTHYGYEWQQTWRKQLQVCSEDIFDKYFSLSIPSSALSEKSLQDLLATVDNLPAFTENLQKFQAENKLRLVLDRLFDHLDELTEEQKEKLLIGVFDFCEWVEDRSQGMIDLQAVDEQTRRLGYQTLKRVTKENRVAFLTKILNSTKSVFSPIQLINMLDYEIEKQEKKESQNEILLTKEELSGLKKVCVDKIRASANDGTLVTNKKFDYLLHVWKEWGSEETVKEYVAGLIKTPAGLLALLKGFEWESISETAGDLVAKSTKKMNKKSLAVFIDISELDKRVQALTKEKLSQEDRETITLYNTPLDRFDELW
jgi:predicted KAP-like P-loop ATPase